MKIMLMGVRGSLPAPLVNSEYSENVKQILRIAIDKGIEREDQIDSFISGLPDRFRFESGGNTTCATVALQNERPIILDAGTGIRLIGDKLMEGECGKGNGNVDIFFTHTHWDHIQGLPFFKPLYVPGNRINFYSPYKELEERLKKQMEACFFPISFETTASTKYFVLIDEKETIISNGDLKIDCSPLKHPGGSYAYRFREGDKIFIFATDAEFTGEDLEKVGGENDFFNNADLLILDSQYTLDESFFKFTWGHTSYTMAVNCGIRWNVKNLVLTHHEPSYSDDKLNQILDEAINHRNAMKIQKPNIYLAREGMTFKL
jgi:phosphoribosyl 1,2-cyclic phosphodiesterase